MCSRHANVMALTWTADLSSIVAPSIIASFPSCAVPVEGARRPPGQIAGTPFDTWVGQSKGAATISKLSRVITLRCRSAPRAKPNRPGAGGERPERWWPHDRASSVPERKDRRHA